MQPIDQTTYVLAGNATPELLAHIMYALLNDENKTIIDHLIERLIAEQS